MGPTEYEYRQALAWIEHLRTRAAQLEAENAHLRIQLDELRRGVGVAVVIQGQAIPLAPLSRQPGAMTGSQPVQLSRSQPTGPISAPFPPALHPSAPLSAPLGGAPSGPLPSPYTENTWLTGPTPAVSPQRAPAQGQQRPAGQHRQGRPSQRVTPEWLRDDSPNGPNNRPSPTSYGPASRATGQIPAVGPRGASTNGQPRPRGGVPARPLGGQASGDRLPSLAELTGHVPVVRGRAKQARRDHEDYDDSFVLG